MPKSTKSRSLSIANEKQLEKVEEAIIKWQITRQKLANLVGVSLPTVNRFLQPCPVDRKNFIEFCKALDLDWHEIAEYREQQTSSLPDNMNFIGRDEALNSLDKFLAQDSQVAIVRGMGEFGETELTILFISAM